MKNISMLVFALAVTALFAKPVFANHEHLHEKGAQAAQDGAAMPAEDRNTYESMMQFSLKNMQSQMAEIHQAEDPEKRLTLLQAHNRSMRDSIRMMREMMGGMAMGNAMESGHMMGGSRTGDHCDHKKGDHMMGGNMAGDHKMCDHKKGNHSAHHHDGSADAAPGAHSNLDQIIATDKTPASPTKKLWVCPMHPEITQDHPGVCPKCGMDLVEMEQPGASQPEHGHMMGSSMKCNNMKGSGTKGCCKKDDCKKSGCMKCGCMKDGGTKCQMMGMMEKRMDMMLMLMEQMLEHNEEEMAAPK